MASNSKLKLKLLIEKKSQKVLFAEADKDVVDFLFSLLAMPIGSVIKLITKESMTGRLGATYGILKQLDDTYLLSTQTKSHLLNPTTSTAVSTNPLLLSAADAACRKVMTVEAELEGDDRACGPIAKKEEKGEKGFVTYAIMDDLSVMPMSTISTVTLLNRFGIKDLSTLQEKTVGLSLPEGLELLKASLQSNNVLTDVFLTKKRGGLKQKMICILKITCKSRIKGLGNTLNTHEIFFIKLMLFFITNPENNCSSYTNETQALNNWIIQLCNWAENMAQLNSFHVKIPTKQRAVYIGAWLKITAKAVWVYIFLTLQMILVQGIIRWFLKIMIPTSSCISRRSCVLICSIVISTLLRAEMIR
ncbi:hypothetical protein FCM35_KLT19169 [Carex littledalei]|uniref:DUF674 domain-containing protein n=1 Tax=Carex littledalei TaxID=544730 RepID=A0A833VV64_9POAL|nr:hypothetical protein FCM35_KLT19169 [Carex littledalei]